MRALFPEIIVALLPPLLFFLSLSLPPPHLPSPISSLSAILSSPLSLYLCLLSFHSKLFREFNPFFFGASSSRGLPALAPVFSLFFALFALHVVARPDKARGNDIARDKYQPWPWTINIWTTILCIFERLEVGSLRNRVIVFPFFFFFFDDCRFYLLIMTKFNDVMEFSLCSII